MGAVGGVLLGCFFFVSEGPGHFRCIHLAGMCLDIDCVVRQAGRCCYGKKIRGRRGQEGGLGLAEGSAPRPPRVCLFASILSRKYSVSYTPRGIKKKGDRESVAYFSISHLSTSGIGYRWTAGRSQL